MDPARPLARDIDETLVRQLLAATRDGVAIIGPTGRLVDWNSAAQAITGWSASEAEQHTLSAIPEGVS
jgi:PAS domain S-box-containing protein